MNSFIKSLMEERCLRQKELAAILGISSAAVSQWNEEGTNISIDCLFTLSKLFHVTVDELLNGRRIGESLEDKWRRDYDINEESAKTALIDGEKENVLKYLAALSKANKKFFELFEKKVIGDISENELKEWEYLKQFYNVNIRRCHLLNGVRIERNDDIDEIILNNLMQIIKENNKAIIWELKKIYKIEDYGITIDDSKIVVPNHDDIVTTLVDPYMLDEIENDEEVYFAFYNSLSPTEKDKILTSLYKSKKRWWRLQHFIEYGGNILYTPGDLNLANYDYKDLDGFEGEISSVPELDNAQAVVYEIYDNWTHATYEQYQALINHPRMRQIEMEAKYKEKNPIKYWEYIKSNEVLI
jgi:transcriptional regulator with XRE-family HTH domain